MGKTYNINALLCLSKLLFSVIQRVFQNDIAQLTFELALIRPWGTGHNYFSNYHEVNVAFNQTTFTSDGSTVNRSHALFL
jgi:hypothetical protein